jgi:hypothetical protein
MIRLRRFRLDRAMCALRILDCANIALEQTFRYNLSSSKSIDAGEPISDAIVPIIPFGQGDQRSREVPTIRSGWPE